MSDIDLDTLKQQIRSGGNQYEIWYLNMLENLDPMAQGAYLVNRVRGAFRYSFIFTGDERTRGAALHIDSDGLQLRVYPLVGDEYLVPCTIPMVQPYLDNGDIPGIRALILGAIDGEIKPVDKTALVSALDLFDTYTPGDYTPNSWSVYANAASAGQLVLDDDLATQTDVNDAVGALNSARLGLTVLADKTAMLAAIQNRDDLVADDYTVNSWAATTAPYNTATGLVSNLNATQSQVDNATDALLNAIDELVNIVGLKNTIITANDMSESDYTPNSWAPFLTARNNAIAVRDDPAATVSQVNTAESTLTTRMADLVPRADKTDLIFRINQYDGLNSDDYTPATWLPYSDDVSEGIAVRDDLNATQLQVTNAVQDIVLSFNALVLRADKTLLIAAITEYDNRTDETDYSVSSWQSYSAQVAAGIIVRDNHNATQLATDNARMAIIQARDALVSMVALVEAIDLANERVESDYTPDSWSPFINALNSANSVNSNPAATQAQVNTATDDLNHYSAQLVLRADTVSLAATVSTAEGLNEGDYTPASWSGLVSALTAAQAVLSNLNATQSQVNTADTNLQSAISALVTRADKSDLVIALAAVEALTENDYTPASWTPVQNAYDAGVLVNNNLNATQDAVNTATSDINTAVSDLVNRADKTALVDAIGLYEATDDGNYTATSWSVYTTAYNTAVSVSNDVNATQASVNSSVTAMGNARAALVDITELTDALATTGGAVETSYTPDSWAPYATARQNAIDLLDAGNGTQPAVDNATSALLSAHGSLVPRANKSLLITELNISNALEEDDYTPASWAPFAIARSSADTVLGDLNATQSEVDNATSSLGTARSNLINRADKTSLGVALTTANELDPDDYTVESWDDFVIVRSAASAVFGDLNATQSAVDDAEQELLSAIDQLAPADVN